MAQIAPWTLQPDFLGAIRSGAGLGLDRGRLNLGYANLAQNQDEAVNRLQFAYDQLASQQEESQANREERAQLASEALKERALESSLRLMELASHHAAAAGYQKEALEAKKAADALRANYQQGMLRVAEQKANAETTLGEPTTQELFPGSNLHVVRVPGSRGWQIVDRNKGTKQDLTPAQLLGLIAREDAIAGNSMTLPATRKEAANTSSQLRNYLSEKMPDLLKPSPPPPPQAGASLSPKPIKQFDSEEAARLEGYGPGDIIQLKGVGKVRLK